MPKEIRLNAFEMCGVGFVAQGQWVHPRDDSLRYNDLDHWVNLVKILERGCFDALFLADGQGPPDVYGGNADAALRSGAFIPVNDPLVLISALALVTENLGFGVTYNVSFEAPYILARRLSTLDHLSKGRIAWNIVTGTQESAARAAGLPAHREHDTRYDMADEYMEIVYKLWEGSWEDGAVLRDRDRRIFADPAKVHKIIHHGKFFDMEGIHMCEPSRQRTPLLYQAGGSDRGRDFAAKHAECVFVNGLSIDHVREKVRDIRQRAAAGGRRPDDIRIFLGATAIVGRTSEEAQRKLKEYQDCVSFEGGMVALSTTTGVDFAKVEGDKKVQVVGTNASQSVLPAYAAGQWTPEAIANHIGGRGPVFVGNPAEICDELQRWAEEAEIDGFNLGRAVKPETFADFVDLAVPEMQRRGLMKKQYRPGTLREKIFEAGPRLGERHVGAQFRKLG